MAAQPFLREYLYGPDTEGPKGRSRSSATSRAIPGRRAPAYLAKRFHQIMRAVLAEVLEPYGIMELQWGVMVAIVREPGADQRRVAERQSMDANSVSRVIDELESSGLVRRVASPGDRRAHRLELTPAGVRLRAKLQDVVIRAQERVLECLEPACRVALLDMLTRVVEANKEHARPGAGRRKPARKSLSMQSGQPA